MKQPKKRAGTALAAAALALLLLLNFAYAFRDSVRSYLGIVSEEQAPAEEAAAEPEEDASAQISRLAEIEEHMLRERADGFTDEEIAAITEFYSQSAFVGDSLLVGFRAYLQKNDREGIFARATLLASYSYSTRSAITPISEKSFHPVYRGKQQLVWDSVKMAGAKRVFLMFWANEIPRSDIELAISNLTELVKRIKAESPEVEIYVVSPCHMYSKTTHETHYLNNRTLTMLAKAQKDFCTRNNAGYVEVAKYIGNEKEGLFEEYTSDYYVHVNDAAYDIWKQVFMEYALGRVPVINNGH